MTLLPYSSARLYEVSTPKVSRAPTSVECLFSMTLLPEGGDRRERKRRGARASGGRQHRRGGDCWIVLATS
jgi:hypothetical protein